jgi:hypothetical protein
MYYTDLSTVAAKISIAFIRSKQQLGLKLNGLLLFREKAKFSFHETRPNISVFAKTTFTAENFNDDISFYKNL